MDASPVHQTPLSDGRSRSFLRAPGLSVRLLGLTILFVMVAEVLIYVPSVANFRRNWLMDRLAAAQVAALVLDAAPPGRLPEDLAVRVLAEVGAKVVAVRSADRRQLLAMRTDPMPEVSRTVDLRRASWQRLIMDAFTVLLAPARAPIRVVGRGMEGTDSVEIVLDEAPLRSAMLDFSRNILLLSLLISGITASLVFFALQWVIVRPVRRLAGNIAAFADAPEDASRIISPSARLDEIGVAERALARMEGILADQLRQKRRLAELGLAVSKINHELRNMLTTAQLLTDRLDRVSDPAVQRVAPRLMKTLSRAIEFCQATLAYGRAVEHAPRRRSVRLAPIVEDLRDVSAVLGRDIAFRMEVPADLMVHADPDQLSRVLANLVRNAVQAHAQGGEADKAAWVAVGARRDPQGVIIKVADNGPGLPERARAHLFEPFQGSARPGGTGLGLAVAAELVALHGGTLSLLDGSAGACFRIVIPNAPASSAPSA